ncbi:hypothetical protein BVC80_1715g53 [Macleaya cordata]|uniref:Uncharacterized protein n=1 Tax=Macleaya cordata TaxID=56857 RepID=A0A200Q270_MACCD|nr:hypothetical protein BVC80_1715g53 [Macleaya cordata]
MESDDDYQIFSSPEEPSSPIHQTKLKRLKKSVSSGSVFPQPVDQSPSEQIYSSTQDTDYESSKTLDIRDSVDPFQPVSGSEGLDDGGDSANLEEGFLADRDSLEDERTVDVDEEEHFGDLDAVTEEFVVKRDDLINELRAESVQLKTEKRSERKRRSSEGGVEDKKNKKKREKKVADDDGKPEAPARTKRRLEKERKIHLEQLHAESQRLLRESRDAEFKPVPLVQKPISSILEKIRQRKLEVAKKARSLNSYGDSTDSFGDNVLDHSPKHARSDEEGEEKHPEEDRDVPLVYKERNNLDAANVHTSSDPASPSCQHENILADTALDEESKNASQTPNNDTQQDIFYDSQPSDREGVSTEGQVDSPLEEVLAPSLLTMKLKLDAAQPNDISSDEEENDKENVEPHPHKLVDVDLYPKGDPVKAFVDDEAEEEDDSDNDLMRFKEDEDEEENEASEEFKDLIVTGYKEKPIDNEKRDQLHQMWLQQQDAAATDNVLQRLKCGLKQKEPSILEEDEEDEEDEELDDDSLDEVVDHLSAKNLVRINAKKVKQMIPHMFTDKDDTFLSDDEETEQKLVRQLLLEKSEEDSSFLSPAVDESSREVFGLIRKLNIAPDTRKRAKSSCRALPFNLHLSTVYCFLFSLYQIYAAVFDMLITGGNSNSSSKSSFLGRVTSNSLPTSNKHVSSNVRSFIFGRDDSNSRSGVTTSEVSSDLGVKEKRATRSASAKFSNSQSKCSTQSTVTETSSSGSLLEVLRRSSSLQSDHHTQNNKMVGKTQSVIQFAAFKSGKKSIKIEGRT